ncbi:glutathione S-transferase class-mu 26 kDa isozyme 47-like isoform X3 [Varroa jacobsoni]|uniref:glutathione S-transferase class-mu 26 kDa isozyme 47-like isoform X3 n=1 Tax=Varroa jacobsoni TaxID=62625 RepID=UPI000BF494B5|nr:glutathione S-transferase class-mu 26 kDa isozyme 47-like isoform X3 [Varroa jacobsoni]
MILPCRNSTSNKRRAGRISTMKLGYWNVRGLCSPIRYLLEYVGAEYDEVRYETSDAPKWQDDKTSLGMEFPNIPYLFDDDDLKLTQSMAILRYLGGKYQLTGVQLNSSRSPLQQKAIVDMVEQQLHDLRMSYVYYGFGVKDELDWIAPEGLIKAIPRFLKPWSNRLENRRFLFGDEISYVDFLLFEILDIFQILDAGVIDTPETKSLRTYYNHVRALPKLKAYLESERHISWPVFGPSAEVWGHIK